MSNIFHAVQALRCRLASTPLMLPSHAPLRPPSLCLLSFLLQMGYMMQPSGAGIMMGGGEMLGGMGGPGPARGGYSFGGRGGSGFRGGRRGTSRGSGSGGQQRYSPY